MKRTTLILEDGLLAGIRRKARRRDCDMSTVVNECLLASLHGRKAADDVPREPAFAMSGVIDTSLLLYTVNRDCQEHAGTRTLIESARCSADI